jgi:hypothetical protein
MALSKSLKNLLKEHQLGRNKAQKMADSRVQEALEALADWVSSHDSLFQWNAAEGLNGATASTKAPAALALSTTVEVDLTDSLNKTNTFAQNASVTVSISSGTATGKKINGGTAPIVLSMVDGKATLTASATAAGTMVLGLSAPSPAGLAVSDVLTITFS